MINTKIACLFGDSVARGIVLDESGRYAPIRDSFGACAADRLGFGLVNKSRFGCTVTKGFEVVKNFLATLRDLPPSVGILEFGGNDCDFRWDEIAAQPHGTHEPATPLAGFRRVYGEMIAALRARGIEPILLTLPPLDAERYFAWFTRGGLDRDAILSWLGDVQHIYRWHERYNDAVWKTALDSKCRIVDVRGAFLGTRDYREYMCADGIHPNREGHRLIEGTLIAAAASL